MLRELIIPRGAKKNKKALLISFCYHVL